jgi:hypothetical protein
VIEISDEEELPSAPSDSESEEDEEAMAIDTPPRARSRSTSAAPGRTRANAFREKLEQRRKERREKIASKTNTQGAPFTFGFGHLNGASPQTTHKRKGEQTYMCQDCWS